MKTHRNYFEIEADSHYDLGLRKGELFAGFLRECVNERKRHRSWNRELDRARAYVSYAAKAFPNLIEEVHGYADRARVCFECLWLLVVEDELSESAHERCTTIVTNRGRLVGHNEDWESNARDSVCVLRSTIGQYSALELFYLNTLGGNAVSINSHGLLHAVNTMNHTDGQLGVPRNLVARWMSETGDPRQAAQSFGSLRRASGYHHTLVHKTTGLWSIESTATRHEIRRPVCPFVHTNHYLGTLSDYESRGRVPGTRSRYRVAAEESTDDMTVCRLQALLSNASAGKQKSILNERTIARLIFDFDNNQAHVWLLRERKLGWVIYPMPLNDRTHTALSAPLGGSRQSQATVNHR